MRYKINIISNKNIYNFLTTLLFDHELIFMKPENIDYNLQNAQANIVILNDSHDVDLIKFKKMNRNYLIISNINNNMNLHNNIQFLAAPLFINNLVNTIENFLQNLKIKFHDISIENEKLINLNNNLFCYLTKVELEILKCLIIEKKINKNFIKKNILNIKSDIQTNSLESHLTRIRKKMDKVKTSVKIQTKKEKLSISI